MSKYEWTVKELFNLKDRASAIDCQVSASLFDLSGAIMFDPGGEEKLVDINLQDVADLILAAVLRRIEELEWEYSDEYDGEEREFATFKNGTTGRPNRATGPTLLHRALTALEAVKA